MNIKFVCITVISFFLLSCTIYTEKQSQALSRAVYATKDSLENARLDLADVYSTETTRIVKPPKERIKIEGIYKKNIDIITIDNKPNSPTPKNKQRVLIIPEKYKNDSVVVINSEEYQNLLKDKEIYQQLEQDYNLLTSFKKEVDDELIKQKEYTEKMIKDLNIMQKKLVEKDLAILKRNIAIVILVLMIGGGIYLRIKGIL
jgi:hypothetical protein